jgi:phosphatidylglycerophosphatase A
MAGLRSLPHGMPFWHPACVIATWFGSGLIPGAPGTWGSLAALPLAWLVLAAHGPVALAVLAAGLFAIGLMASAIYAGRCAERDPQSIVIDEVAGQCLVLTAAPPDWGYVLAGFLLFRLADIAKPWPASWADRSLAGAPGIMLDDLFAAAYAWLVLYAMFRLIG